MGDIYVYNYSFNITQSNYDELNVSIKSADAEPAIQGPGFD